MPVLAVIIWRNRHNQLSGAVSRAVAGVFSAVGLAYLFLIVVIGSMAAPFHLALAVPNPEGPEFPWWLWLGVIFGLGVGAGSIVLPLQAGARNLRAMEF